MSIRFSVLASGSAGNATLLEVDGYGLLLDAGLGPRQLLCRFSSLKRNWSHVHAVLLTHTHSDHWKRRTFGQLARKRIPLYCHVDHHDALRAASGEFYQLYDLGLVRAYEAWNPFELTAGLRCLPLPLMHDGGETFGFRLEIRRNSLPPLAIGYVADLGSWDESLANSLANVDVLAIEFNHDVEMQFESGRSPYLIERVLGDRGHLSNQQAAMLLREVLRRSQRGRIRHVVQLHLSRECNLPPLAVEAARAILDSLDQDIDLHTAAQHCAGPVLALDSPVWKPDLEPAAAAMG